VEFFCEVDGDILKGHYNNSSNQKYMKTISKKIVFNKALFKKEKTLFERLFETARKRASFVIGESFEDIAQTVFLQWFSVKRKKKFESIDHLVNIFGRACVNKAKDLLRRKKRITVLQFEEALPSSPDELSSSSQSVTLEVNDQLCSEFHSKVNQEPEINYMDVHEEISAKILDRQKRLAISAKFIGNTGKLDQKLLAKHFKKHQSTVSRRILPELIAEVESIGRILIQNQLNAA